MKRKNSLNLKVSWSKKTTANPTKEAIDDAIARLKKSSDYLILCKDEVTYVQASAGVVEYRKDGKQYQHTFDQAEFKPVRDALTCFVEDGPMHSLLPWRDITDEIARRRAADRLMFALALLLAIAFVAWSTIRR